MFAPALSNACAESYSQLLPGNTGINTVGLAVLFLQTYISEVLYSFVTAPSSKMLFLSALSESSSERGATEGNTFSSLFFQFSSASASEITTSPTVKLPSSVTTPIFLASLRARTSPAFSAGTSIRILPFYL